MQREIRQRCGFGCVICGRIPYDYEHFDPPFAQAREHRAEGITLLCKMCHGDRGGRRLSVDRVKRGNASPYCKSHDAVWIQRLGDDPITLVFGANTFGPRIDVAITHNGEDILRIRKTEDSRWAMSGTLRDSSGRQTLTFKDDQVVVYKGSWDVEFVGPKMRLRSAQNVWALPFVGER